MRQFLYGLKPPGIPAVSMLGPVVRKGDVGTDFELPDETGAPRRLSGLLADVTFNRRSVVSLPGNPLPIRQERSIAGKAAMKATSSSVRNPSLGLAQLQKWAAIFNAMSLIRCRKRSS